MGSYGGGSSEQAAMREVLGEPGPGWGEGGFWPHLADVNGGTRLLVTDNAGASVAVVNPAAAVARRGNALIGYLQAAALPRFFAYVPGAPDVLIVNGGAARQIQAIKADDLP